MNIPQSVYQAVNVHPYTQEHEAHGSRSGSGICKQCNYRQAGALFLKIGPKSRKAKKLSLECLCCRMIKAMVARYKRKILTSDLPCIGCMRTEIIESGRRSIGQWLDLTDWFRIKPPVSLKFEIALYRWVEDAAESHVLHIRFELSRMYTVVPAGVINSGLACSGGQSCQQINKGVPTVTPTIFPAIVQEQPSDYEDETMAEESWLGNGDFEQVEHEEDEDEEMDESEWDNNDDEDVGDAEVRVDGGRQDADQDEDFASVDEDEETESMDEDDDSESMGEDEDSGWGEIGEDERLEEDEDKQMQDDSPLAKTLESNPIMLTTRNGRNERQMQSNINRRLEIRETPQIFTDEANTGSDSEQYHYEQIFLESSMSAEFDVSTGVEDDSRSIIDLTGDSSQDWEETNEKSHQAVPQPTPELNDLSTSTVSQSPHHNNVQQSYISGSRQSIRVRVLFADTERARDDLVYGRAKVPLDLVESFFDQTQVLESLHKFCELMEDAILRAEQGYLMQN